MSCQLVLDGGDTRLPLLILRRVPARLCREVSPLEGESRRVDFYLLRRRGRGRKIRETEKWVPRQFLHRFATLACHMGKSGK